MTISMDSSVEFLYPASSDAAKKAHATFGRLAAPGRQILVQLGKGLSSSLIAGDIASAICSDGEAKVVTWVGEPQQVLDVVATAMEDGKPVVAIIETTGPPIEPLVAMLKGSKDVSVVLLAHGQRLPCGLEDTRWEIATWLLELPDWNDVFPDPVSRARYLFEKESARTGRPAEFSRGAVAAIREHTWPGGDAEMSAAIKRALALAEDTTVSSEDLGLPENQTGKQVHIPPLKEAKTLFNHAYVKGALALARGNRTRAAKLLGVDARTVFRVIEEVKGGEDSGGGGRWEEILVVVGASGRV
ncbi:MAG: hypothetical protein GY854_25410 [Deltaproteobacteria bacterium]|nr:hypothetical protein [Deltaproteobacteria bacterium]